MSACLARGRTVPAIRQACRMAHEELLDIARTVARGGGRARGAPARRGRGGRGDEVVPDRHRHRGRPRDRGADPRPPRRAAPRRRLPRRGVRRGGAQHAASPGSSTRSTARSTTSTACRTGRSPSRSWRGTRIPRPGPRSPGAVHAPALGELYTASAGGGAHLGGRRLHVRDAVPLDRALVATGFHYTQDIRTNQARVAQPLLARVRDLRRAGGAAIDLASVAAGRHRRLLRAGPEPVGPGGRRAAGAGGGRRRPRASTEDAATVRMLIAGQAEVVAELHAVAARARRLSAALQAASVPSAP